MTAAQHPSRIEEPAVRPFRLGVHKLVVAAGCLALLLAAWGFHREKPGVDPSQASRDLDVLRRSEDPLARRAAAESLRGVFPADVGRAVAALCAALSDGDPRVRGAAVKSLGVVFYRGVAGSPGDVDELMEAATRGLLGARHDPDPSIRAAVARSLGKLAPKPENAPPALMAMLDEDPDEAVRSDAASALGRPWRDRDAVFMGLLERLGRLDRVDRIAAWRSLLNMRCVPPRALPALIEALEDRKDPAADIVCQLIGELGSSARPALPALAALARRQLAEGVRLTAVEALVAIDADSAEAQSLVAPLVDDVLRAENAGLLRDSTFALQRFGPHARAAVAPLRAARVDRNPEVRRIVEQILERIDVETEPSSSGR